MAIGLAVVLASSLTALAKSAPVAPFEPLSAKEIAATTLALEASADFPKGALFPIVVLNEPAKRDVLAGAPTKREAYVVVLDRDHNKTFEAIVDVAAKKVTSWKQAPGAQPAVLAEEFDLVPKLVRADPRFAAAMQKRNIDPADVLIDVWAAAHVRDESLAGKRILRAVFYAKGKSAYFYSRPIEGVTAIVDMNEQRVLSVDDREVVPVSSDPGTFDDKSVGPLRAAMKPMTINQPKGGSFTITGNEIRWDKWRFSYALHPREGLVLYQVGYEDGGKVRPVLYRGSISEMVVPYGDPDPDWEWRAAFDVGEYGIGRLASPLDLGTDLPPNATTLDATFADDHGKPYVLPRAVGIYEVDGGLLWKHFDSVASHNESRRARDLVITFMAAVSNYDYAINWIFHQDGSIEMRCNLSGIMLAKGVARASDDGHAHGGASEHLVSANVAAPHHQHFFNFRLDLDVDGTNNAVAEMSTHAAPASQNPFQNGILMEDIPLTTEKAAARDLDVATQRRWRVYNPSIKNALGQPVSYVLIGGDNSIPYLNPQDPTRKRAGFINHHFWATLEKDDEMYAGGRFPNQSKGGGDGLAQFAADDEALDGKDVVVWYTMAVTHTPRPEEWPVMPTAHIGFKLLPASFFARNPALDVPNKKTLQ